MKREVAAGKKATSAIIMKNQEKGEAIKRTDDGIKVNIKMTNV